MLASFARRLEGLSQNLVLQGFGPQLPMKFFRQPGVSGFGRGLRWDYPHRTVSHHRFNATAREKCQAIRNPTSIRRRG
jgi:hypothetical protein